MFQKGQPKMGGRKAGTPNRRTLALRERLDALVETLDPEGLASDVVASKDLSLRWDFLRWALEKLHGRPKQAVDFDANLVSSPEWQSLRAKILDALEPHPDARAAILDALDAAKDEELRPPVIVTLDLGRLPPASIE